MEPARCDDPLCESPATHEVVLVPPAPAEPGVRPVRLCAEHDLDDAGFVVPITGG